MLIQTVNIKRREYVGPAIFVGGISATVASEGMYIPGVVDLILQKAEKHQAVAGEGFDRRFAVEFEAMNEPVLLTTAELYARLRYHLLYQFRDKQEALGADVRITFGNLKKFRGEARGTIDGVHRSHIDCTLTSLTRSGLNLVGKQQKHMQLKLRKIMMLQLAA